MSNLVSEERIKIEHEESFLEVLCDVVHNNWPDGIVVRPIEIQGIIVSNFKRDYVIDIANKCHEQLVNDLAEKQQSKLDYYDEGER